MKQVEAVKQLLREHPARPSGEGTGWAPVNIALCKYWGKRDQELNLPLTSSLSVSLGDRGTRTRIQPADEDGIRLNGEAVPPDSSFAVRAARFLDLFRTSEMPAFLVETESNVPVAAGLASSASGFAALVLALENLMGWGLDRRALSMLARMGSGSASRSLFSGFVEWHAGERADGFDSYAEALEGTWPDLRVGLLMVSEAEKPIGSRAGMQRTLETSALYAAWPELVARDIERIKPALASHDLAAAGAVAESNALAMHATMISAWPPVVYWTPASVEAMHRLWALRADGLPLYFTMDAGPNLKLLFEAGQEETVKEAFPGVMVVRPF